MRGRYGTRRAAYFPARNNKNEQKLGVRGARRFWSCTLLWFALILTQAHADWVMGAIIVMLFVTMNIAGLGGVHYRHCAPRATGSCWA